MSNQGLQFETAESIETPAMQATQAPQSTPATCSSCQQPIGASYFTVTGQVACERCKSAVEAVLQTSAGVGGFARALVLGSLAGIAGAAVWYGIRAVTGYELGLIAIGVGYFVGYGVRKGSGGRGGLAFQVLAVVLTYVWIAANYVPDIAAAFGEADAAQEAGAGDVEGGEYPAPVFAFAVVSTALALPFLTGLENALGILIIGFALFEAWKINRRVEIAVAGPFALAGDARPASLA